MRKTIVALLLCSVAALVWRAHDRDESRLAFDRFWIDRMPQSPKEKFNVFVLGQKHHAGMFGAQTAWAGQWEAFRFGARDGGGLDIVYPEKGDRENVQVRARRCNEAGFDYCLELTGSKRGARRYYSKREWDKSGMEDPLLQTIEALRTADVAAQ